MKKTHLIILLTALFGFAGFAFALPIYQQTQSMIPARDGVYDLGTTSPTNLRYNGYFNNITIDGTCTGSGCGTGGGGGGGGSGAFLYNVSKDLNYPATTTSSFVIGGSATTTKSLLNVLGIIAGDSLIATSTTATSTFAGGLNVADSSGTGFRVLQNGKVRIGTDVDFLDYLGTASNPFNVTDNINDISGVNYVNRNNGGNAAICQDFANGRTLLNTPYYLNSYYASICFSGQAFNLFPGLPPNSLGITVPDGLLALIAPSINPASSTVVISSGPGYITGNYDQVFKTDSSGFPIMGLSTTSPFARLSIAHLPNDTKPIFAISTSTASATTTAFIIDRNGKVGIGTANPAGSLQIFNGAGTGNILFGAWGASSNYGAISLNGSLATGDANLYSSPSDRTFYINRPTSANIQFSENNGNPQMVIRATTGNVGIGTTTPDAKLHIYENTSVTAFTGDNVPTLRLSTGPTATPNMYSLLGFSGGGGSYTQDRNLAQIGAYIGSSGSLLQFGTSNNYTTGITNTALTINETGNIGIGTTTPFAKLSIAGESLGTNNLFTISTSTATATSTAVIVDSQGRFGVGTTTPYARMAVNGMIAGSEINTYDSLSTSTIAGRMQIGSSTSGAAMLNSKLTVRADDALTSKYMLNMVNSTGATNYLSLRNDGTFNSNSSLSFGAGLGITGGATGPSILFATGGGSSTGNLNITTGTAGTHRNVVFSPNTGAQGGNVGIGTTSPYAKLSVSGVTTASTTMAVSHVAAGTGDVFNVSTTTAAFATSTVFNIDSQGQVQVKNGVPYFGTGASTAIVCYMSDGSLGHITITSLLASGSCVKN